MKKWHPLFFFLVLLSSRLLSQGVDKGLPEVIEAVLPATVTILQINNTGQIRSYGSGFFISADGQVVTNFHVIERADVKLLQVRNYNGGKFEVTQILATDQLNDLAILKVNATKVVSVKLCDSDSARIGQTIFVIGTPALAELENTVSSGIISQFRSDGGKRAIQFTAAISPGSSGGPIFNVKGEVIGIVRATVEPAVSGRPVQNLNFGIPSNALVELVRTRSKSEPLKNIVPSKSAAFLQILDSLNNEITIAYQPVEGMKYSVPALSRRTVLIATNYAEQLNSLKTKGGTNAWAELSSALGAGDYAKATGPLDFLYQAKLPDTLQFMLGYLSLLSGDKKRGIETLGRLFTNGFLLKDLTAGECASLWDIGFRKEMKAHLLLSERLSKDVRLAIRLASDEVQSNPESAVSLLQRYQNFGSDQNVHELLASYQFKLGNYQKAQTAYRNLIKLDPRSARYHRNLAVCYYRLGIEKDALEELVIASNNSSGCETYYIMGTILLSTRPDVASRIFEENPGCGRDKKVKLALGASYVLLGQKEKALRTYEELTRLDAGLAALLFGLMYD